MKLIFSFNFRLLVLVLLIHSVASVTAMAQTYSYKYIGRFEQSSDTLNTPIPRDDEAQYWRDDNRTISREVCTSGVVIPGVSGTGRLWWTNGCGANYPDVFSCCRTTIRPAVNPMLSGTRPYANAGIPMNTGNIYAHSRDMIMWPNTDFGPYYMEITGMALLSRGIDWTWGVPSNPMTDESAKQQYTNHQFWCHSVWRQVGTDYTYTYDPNNTWGGMTTMAESGTAEQWVRSSMTPKYNILSTDNWNTSHVRGDDQNTRRWNDPAWVEIPMRTPFVFNPDSNLEIVVIRGKATNPPGLVNNFGEITGGQMLGIWAFADDQPNHTKNWRSSFGMQMDDGAMNFRGAGGGMSHRPHLRLHYRYLSCENIKPTVANSPYMTEVTIPIEDLGSSFEMRYAPEGAQHDIIYTIVGPLPATDTLYVSSPVTINTEVRGDDALRTYTTSLGDFENVTARGVAVAADGQSVDCFKLEPGQYTLIASVGTKIAGFYPVEGRTNFSISVGRDLQIRGIIEPEHQHKFVAGTTTPVHVTTEILNNSPADEPAVEEFYATARIYPMAYNATTGTYVRTSNVAIDTLPHKTAGNTTGVYHWTAAKDNGGKPLASGSTTQLHYGQLAPGFPMEKLSVGHYDIEVEVWVDDVDWDRAPGNNIYPRGSWHHAIQIQNEYDIVLTKDEIVPPAGFQTYLGHTVNVTTELTNDGIFDVSDRSGYFLKTSIFRYNRATSTKVGLPVWSPAPYVIRSASSGGETVSVPCINDITLAPIGWQVNDTGTFIVETHLMHERNTIPPVMDTVPGQLSTRIFTVAPGLSGRYTVSSKLGSDFVTINLAVDALYRYGVSGDVRFELPDTGYVESAWTAANVEYPAIDFRGRIAGVCDTLHPAPGITSVRTRKIEFVPTGAVASQRGGVRIRLVSKSGYGMMFGVAENTVAHPMARINDAPVWEKKQWAQSDGNIIWNGGANQSFRFCLVPPTSTTGHTAADYAELDPVHAFQVPIYMANAKDVTIANCIIENNDTWLARSAYFLLPGNSYNMTTLTMIPDYEVGNTITKAYSAGIVMRSIVPYQARYESNYYELDTLPCQNITLQNNDISDFSYGIVSMGLNYLNLNKGSLIDVVDTLRDLSITTLRTSSKYEDCLHAVEYPNVPAGGRTLVTWFKERVPSLARGTRFYKHHSVQQNGGAVSEYVQVIDSLIGGVARAFNRNGLIENNLIHDVGRAGIFLGNDENTVVRSNTITNINGRLRESNGRWGPVPPTGNIGSTYPASAYVTDVDVAGILLGGNQRLHVNETSTTEGFIVVGAEIYKNEISNVGGQSSVSGIKLEQAAINEGVSAQGTTFPDRAERIKIYSNIIWNLLATDANTSRYGINLALAKKNVAPGTTLPLADNMYYSTGHPNHFLDELLVANNTIVLGEDGSRNSSGDYFGIRLQRIKNSRILNNAIELEDSTQVFASNNNNNFAALIYYQGPSPTELNNQIDYNAYGYRMQNSSAVDVYSHALTDVAGSMIDFPRHGEYRNLSNWQNWLHNDFYSVVRSFSGDLEASQDYYPRLRFRTNPAPSNSPLDKRGTYLAEAEVDIDGINRVAVNQNLDIGAQYVSGTKLAYDVEVLNIVSPATYKANVGPWADAEYFMIPDAPITVRAKIRNNGSSIIQSKRINLRVYEEPAGSNNSVATIHNNNHNNTHYDNELALHNRSYTFPAFAPTATPFWEGFQNVTLSPGEDTEIEFQMNKSFNSYYYLQGYTVPIQFSSMIPNVTPRYLFVVSTDDAGDLDLRNDSVQKYARFYIKKSSRNMLVSSVNSYHTMVIPKMSGGNPVLDENGSPVFEANPKIKNLDWVAGKLNLDTLQAGLGRLKYYQIDNEASVFDFDILDRHAWDYRNIDYTLYQTVYLTDELEKNENRWTSSYYDKTLRLFREQYHAKNLLDFLQETASAAKKNLILASENYINDVYKSLFRNQPYYILSNQTQRDTFLYNDSKRLAFVSPERQVAILRDSLQKVLVRDYFRANAVYDSLTENGPYLWSDDIEYQYEYQPIYPFYEKGTIANGGVFEPNWNYLPLPYQFDTKPGTLTGKSLNPGHSFEIKPTGWGWTQTETIVDAPPYGAVYRPIDNLYGQLSVGAVYDKWTPNPAMSSTAPDAGKVAALCVSTIKNNIVLLGFDWRHFGNIEVLLDNIMEYIVKNGGSGDDSPNLPISFYGFDAKAISNRAELFWNTSSGSVINKFEVERADVVSEKIGNFNLIETISAKPTTGDNFYNTTDKNLAFGSSFAYRLKLIDASGSFVYTDTKILNIEASQFSISDIVPNPVNSVSEFSINNQMDQNLHIAVYDMSGKEMFVINTGMLSSGVHNFKINSKDLPQATYSLTIRGEQQTIAKQFTVVR